MNQYSSTTQAAANPGTALTVLYINIMCLMLSIVFLPHGFPDFEFSFNLYGHATTHLMTQILG